MMKTLLGKFIVVDGPDGGGKTTQRDLLAERLRHDGLPVVSCKDPGGTAIGDRIRHVLLDFDLSQMDVACETLLFMASRAQLLSEVVLPALHASQVVLCGRFVSSTCAYQVAAGYEGRRVLELAPFAIGGTWPDLTILFDVDVDTGFQRTGRRASQAGKNRKSASGQQSMFSGAGTDAMEARSMEFHRRVREAFLRLAECYPRPVRMIDTLTGNAREIHQQVLRVLESQFPDRP